MKNIYLYFKHKVLIENTITYMQSTSWEMLGWRKHKLESRLLGEISITSDMQMTPPLWQEMKRTKEPLDESERGEWKSWLKVNIQKTKIMASGLITSWQIDGETMETVTDYFGGFKFTADGDRSHEIERLACSLEVKLWQTKQHIKKQRYYFVDKGLSSQNYGFSSSHV